MTEKIQEKYLERSKKEPRPDRGRAVRLLVTTPVFLASGLEDEKLTLKTVPFETIPKDTIVLIWSHSWPGVGALQDEECTVIWNDQLWATIDAFHKEGLDWEYV